MIWVSWLSVAVFSLFTLVSVCLCVCVFTDILCKETFHCCSCSDSCMVCYHNQQSLHVSLDHIMQQSLENFLTTFHRFNIITYIIWSVSILILPYHRLHFRALYICLSSVQCISSIGQTIKSVCLCVSQSVSESVTRNDLNALQITILLRSSPNLPPT